VEYWVWGGGGLWVYRVHMYHQYPIPTILCHAEKAANNKNEIDNVECQVWENGKLALSGIFRQVQIQLARGTHANYFSDRDG
jgi:hypothetical protein